MAIFVVFTLSAAGNDVWEQTLQFRSVFLPTDSVIELKGLSKHFLIVFSLSCLPSSCVWMLRGQQRRARWVLRGQFSVRAVFRSMETGVTRCVCCNVITALTRSAVVVLRNSCVMATPPQKRMHFFKVCWQFNWWCSVHRYTSAGVAGNHVDTRKSAGTRKIQHSVLCLLGCVLRLCWCTYELCISLLPRSDICTFMRVRWHKRTPHI